MLLQAEFISTLLALIDINTSPPPAGGAPAQIESAQDLYAILAEGIGMHTVFSSQDRPSIRTNSQARWLFNQPHRVLEIGTGDVQHTLMFNFHMDTLGPHLAARVEQCADGEILIGRGAADSKGPAVALLAAIAQILQQQPDIFNHIRIVIQMLGSAKDCAMAAQNTQALVDQGLYGHLNVFMQAHDAHYFEHSTKARRKPLRLSDFGAIDWLAHADHSADGISRAEGMISTVVQPMPTPALDQPEAILINDLYHFMDELGDFILTFADQRVGNDSQVTASMSLTMALGQRITRILPPGHPTLAANGDNFRISL